MRIKLLFAFLSAFLVLGVSTLNAEIIPYTENTLITETTEGKQIQPAIDSAPDGTSVIVWAGLEDGGVFARLIDKKGLKKSERIFVGGHLNFVYVNPDVAFAKDGSFFVVTWTAWHTDGYYSGIHARMFDRNGTALGDEFQVNTTWMSWQNTPIIKMANDNSFVIGWTTNGGSSIGGAYFQKFYPDGDKWGPEFYLNSLDSSEGFQYLSIQDIMISNNEDLFLIMSNRSNGKLVVLRYSYDPIPAYIQEINFSGLLAPKFEILNNQIRIANYMGNRYSSYLRLQDYSFDGEQIGEDTIIPLGRCTNYYYARMRNFSFSVARDGSSVISYTTSGGPWTESVCAVYFDTSGNMEGDIITVKSATPTHYGKSSVVSAMGKERFAVVWQDGSQPGSGWIGQPASYPDLYYRVFGPERPTTIPEVIEIIESLLESGEISNSGIGNALIKKLEAAQKKVEAGQFNVAINIMNATIEQLSALGTNEKHMSQSTSDQLIDYISYISDEMKE